MAQQTINIGNAPNDGTGDQLRTAFDKTNQNFTELYSLVGSGGSNNPVILTPPATSVGQAGDVAGMIAYGDIGDGPHVFICVQDYDGVNEAWIRFPVSPTPPWPF